MSCGYLMIIVFTRLATKLGQFSCVSSARGGVLCSNTSRNPEDGSQGESPELEGRGTCPTGKVMLSPYQTT